MKEYSVNNLKLLVNGECINLGCFVDLVKNKPINMEQYIASYKHLIGCEVYDRDYGNLTICSVSKNNNGGLFFNGNENEPFDSLVSFYLDEENLGTYEEYMQLHYPEYEHVWSKQL